MANDMAEQVSRKKSYRWAAVSQGTYDGADWDSSNSDDDAMGGWDSDLQRTPQAMKQNSPSRHGTIEKLPALPKLAYGKDAEEDKPISDVEATHPPVRSESKSKSSVNDDLDSLMDQISREMTPRAEPVEKFPSNDQLSSSSPVEIPLNAVPVQPIQSKLTAVKAADVDSKRISSYIDDSIGDSDEDLRDGGASDMSGSDDELRVSKNGYFNNYIGDESHQVPGDTDLKSLSGSSGDNSAALDDEKEIVIDDLDEKSEEDADSVKHFKISETSSKLTNENTTLPNNDEEPEATNAKEDTELGRSSPSEKRHSETKRSGMEIEKHLESETPDESKSVQEPLDISPQVSKTEGLRKPSDVSEANSARSLEDIRGTKVIEESDGNDSFLNQYGNNSSQSSPAHMREVSSFSSSPIKLRQTQNTDLSYNHDTYSTDESADESASYVQSITKSPEIENGSFKFSNRERDSIIESSDDGHEENADVGSFNVPKGGYYTNMVEDGHSLHTDDAKNDQAIDEEDLDFSSDENSITQSLNRSESLTHDEASVSATEPSIENELDEETEGEDDKDTSDSEHKRNELDSRQSINLGKWRPDTDSHRSGFVQETAQKAPDGFVIDENGEKVDLNPSSMRQARAVSTYSEVESTWNAFPSNSEEHDDLHTIADTKTIYDNQTIFNVPGVLTNHDSLPPLPNNMSSPVSDGTKTTADSDSIMRKLDGEKTHHQSNFKEDFSVHAPNVEEIAQLKGKLVPNLNLDKVVSAKDTTHAMKIAKLNAYSRELEEYDTGLQTWINFALKSSTSDKDYIFHEYKVSRHVRDAYAHADELSKRVTMSSTVANVNQNVSHLKRKVFSHTMKEKSKGLFSSIGKKL